MNSGAVWNRLPPASASTRCFRLAERLKAPRGYPMSSSSGSRFRLVVRGAACFAALAVVACGSANDNDDAYWKPAADLGGASMKDAGGGGAGGSGGAAGAGGGGGQQQQPTGSVTFNVTTSSYGGRYGPRNVGAIWVETKSGKFVKTLTEWGFLRYGNLVKWRADTNFNKVDAITSATAFSATSHTGKWDYTDVSGKGVPDGQYQFIVEFTEDDSARSFIPDGPWTSVPVTKAPQQKDFNPPDKQYFHNMSVSYKQ